MQHPSIPNRVQVILAVSTAIALGVAMHYYLDDAFLRGERLVLLAFVLWRLWRLEPAKARPPARMGIALWVASTLAFMLSLSVIPSRSLCIYSALGMAASLVLVIYGRRTARHSAGLFLAVAALAYPPQVIFAPFTEALLLLTTSAAGYLSPLFWADTALHGTDMRIGQEWARFVPACSGYQLLMAFAAMILAGGAGRLGASKLSGEILIASAAAIILNIVRVLLIIGATYHGYGEVVFGPGHDLIGSVFIWLGAMFIAWRLSREPRAVDTCPRLRHIAAD